MLCDHAVPANVGEVCGPSQGEVSVAEYVRLIILREAKAEIELPSGVLGIHVDFD